MKSEDYIARESKYLAQTYTPLPVVLTRGDGIWVWDAEDNKYLDFLSAYSAVSGGHLNKRIKKALYDQLEDIDVPSRAFYNARLGEYAAELCKVTGMDKMLPMNTGAEAVEAGIKGARRWGYDVKGIPENKARIIVCEGNFHGRTTTIVGFSSEPSYKRGFGPYDGGFDIIPYGDTESLKKAITPETCAFLVEPIQGEGGINMPPDGWLKEIQDVCRENNVLLILDEIQTGMARTGKNFAFQYEIDKPDGLLLGKALGGGLYPVSAFLAKAEVMNVFDAGSHGSTFGGNPIAAAIGLESLRMMQDENMAEHTNEMGHYLRHQIALLNSPLVTDIRGKGLLIGVEVDPDRASARAICEELKLRGLLCKETHEVVIRFAPPLVIQKEDIDWAVSIFGDVLEVFESKSPIKSTG